MKSGLLLNVVVAQSAAILQLLSGENETLLVWWDSGYHVSPFLLLPLNQCDIPLLVLNLGLHIVDGVRRLHLKGDGLPRKGLDEDLHLRSV